MKALHVESSAFEHLRRSISAKSPKQLFAMLTCYFDEAGGEDTGFVIVSGYISTASQWEIFETDWKIVLAKYDVPYLHMKEISAFKGPFAKWKNAPGTRARFLQDAASVISATAKQAISCYVDYAAFKGLNNEYELDNFFKSPYAIAGRTCVAIANDWSKKVHREMPTQYVFEDGGPDQSGLVEAIVKFPPRMPIPIFEPGRDKEYAKGLVQLQAADFLAYEMRKYVLDHPKYRVRGRTPRLSLKALTQVPHNWVFYDSDKLRNVCTMARMKKRSFNLDV